MRKRILFVLVIVLLAVPVAVAEDVSPPPGGGGGCTCNCNCPSEEKLAKKVVEKLNESSRVGFIQKIGNLDALQSEANMPSGTNLSIDTPLSEVGDFESTHPKVSGALKFFGIDLSVLSVRDIPAIIGCAVSSTGELWGVLSATHSCIQELVENKLAKRAPAEIAKESINKSEMKKILIAQEATTLISKELSGNATFHTFDAFFREMDE